MKKKFLRIYLILFFVSLFLILIDGFSDIKLGNKCYDLFSFNFCKFFSRVSSGNDLEEENKQLLKKMAALSYKKQMFDQLRKENQELKKILEFRFNYPKFIVPAEITRKTPEEVNLSYRIGKGISDGIEKNAPVISFNGLVGKVLKVNKNTSVIQTLKNYNSAVSIRDTRSKEQGILKWNKKFFIEGMPQYADIKKGDTIVTSGVGSVFPRGLPVGVVTSVEKQTNDYSLGTEVVPFDDFDKIDVIFIIKK